MNQNTLLDKEARKKIEREERIRKEREELEHMQNYNPFGKGGSGAPRRDVQGNIIASFKQEGPQNAPNSYEPSAYVPQRHEYQSSTAPGQPRQRPGESAKPAEGGALLVSGTDGLSEKEIKRKQ